MVTSSSSEAAGAPHPDRQAELWALMEHQPQGDAVEVIRQLLAHGANPAWVDLQDGSSPMHRAARGNMDGWVIAWKAHGLDLHAPSNSGWTQAMDAVGSGSSDYLRRLLEVGLNPNDPRDRVQAVGTGLLAQAAFAKSATMVSTLLEFGADVDHRGSDQKQALHDSAECVQCLQLLIAAGANVNSPEKYGDRLVHRVVEEKITDTFVFLLDRPDVDWLSENQVGMVPRTMALQCDVLGDLMRSHMSFKAAHEAINGMRSKVTHRSAARGHP